MRKSIKIVPGVRLNVSAKSVGISAGVKGARISANSSGRVTRTVGVPGTGVSHSKTINTRSSGAAKSPAREPVTAPRPVQASTVKPGLMAPGWEKALFKTLKKVDGPKLHALAQQHPDHNQTISYIEMVEVALPAGDTARVRALLNWLHDVAYRPEDDAFVTKYLPRRTVALPVAQGISATMPATRDAFMLLLAEIEQADGNRARAIEVVEGLEPTTIAAVSLAELYAEEGRWSDIIDLTNGLTNEDEPSTYLLIQRGGALREQGYAEASREALKEALRIRSRPTELRNLALVERGKTYLSENKRAMARKDFERVMADSADWPGLDELIAASS
ncbi:DUF4236 domain-containing protein [Microbacterium saccharophilum]|uniref:DUF4236 domain-containing protein n=1 Tax=Microbacterium saccharophilum TaxID=1213358 RepID=UPI001C3F7147|nr:DUF4236 domain-containing protein [Microbacterium saccharophilum]